MKKQSYVVTERTAKRFKLISLLMVLISLWGIGSCLAGDPNGGFLSLGGIFGYAINRMIAWWYHG